MNVSTKLSIASDPQGNKTSRRILVAARDFTPGEVIYKEQPVVTVLDFDLQGKGKHCSHCFRSIEQGVVLQHTSKLPSEFCSKECLLKSTAQSHNLLFTLEPPLPPMLAPVSPPETVKKREEAQAGFVRHIKEKEQVFPLLVAKFIGRQVTTETQKMLPNPSALQPKSDLPQADSGDYSLYDHIERLRYLESSSDKTEIKTIRDVLQTAVPGIEEFVTPERYEMLLGKMAYNSYGVCFGGGRSDKPAPKHRPEDVEKTRTPYGTDRQVGTGFYMVSSYISHSCDPSARPSFCSGTAELHLTANRAIKEGEEITVAFVDITQHPGESPSDARERRRTELAKGWRFSCNCTRCLRDADGVASPHRDESKLGENIAKVEERIGSRKTVEEVE